MVLHVYADKMKQLKQKLMKKFSEEEAKLIAYFCIIGDYYSQGDALAGLILNITSVKAYEDFIKILEEHGWYKRKKSEKITPIRAHILIVLKKIKNKLDKI